jgi:hypothetical protein
MPSSRGIWWSPFRWPDGRQRLYVVSSRGDLLIEPVAIPVDLDAEGTQAIVDDLARLLDSADASSTTGTPPRFRRLQRSRRRQGLLQLDKVR